MREILFRGKWKCNGKWVEGSLLIWSDGGAEICHTNPENEDELQKVIVWPETVGQFTGLTDKNGKKIFEGDIVEVMHESVYRCRWNEGNCEFGFVNESVSFGLAYVSPDSMVIIGNIHDNPELLEVPHDA